MAPIRLKNHLLCDYDTSLRPVVDHRRAVNVTFRIIVKYFTYSHDVNTLSIDAWVTVYWKDEHLTWKPDDFESINTVHLSTDQIWVPDLSVYNRDTQASEPSIISNTRCVITSNGLVVCVPPVRLDALCVADLKKFPFDVQNCTIRIGSWIHKGEEINVTLPNAVVTTDELVSNGEWELQEYKAKKDPGHFKCCPNSTYPSINISFKIRRIAGAHAASVIIPAVVAIVITLSSLWISPTHKDRFNLCCINLIAQYLHIQYVSWVVPPNGENMPQLLLLARDSLLLASFTIVFTLLIKGLSEQKSPPPMWISSIVSFLIGCKPGQFIFLNDYSVRGVASAKGEEDGTTIISNSENNTSSQDWTIFAKILDRLCFLTYVIIYICMVLAFLP